MHTLLSLGQNWPKLNRHNIRKLQLEPRAATLFFRIISLLLFACVLSFSMQSYKRRRTRCHTSQICTESLAVQVRDPKPKYSSFVLLVTKTFEKLNLILKLLECARRLHSHQLVGLICDAIDIERQSLLSERDLVLQLRLERYQICPAIYSHSCSSTAEQSACSNSDAMHFFPHASILCCIGSIGESNMSNSLWNHAHSYV